MIDTDLLRNKLIPLGLRLVHCCDTHCQVSDDVGPILDVWPSVNKVREVGGRGKAFRINGEDDIVRSARKRQRHNKGPAPFSEGLRFDKAPHDAPAAMSKSRARHIIRMAMQILDSDVYVSPETRKAVADDLELVYEALA